MTGLHLVPNEELVEWLVASHSPGFDFEDVRAEVLRRLDADAADPFVLPVSITEAIRHTLGRTDRTFKAAASRVRFAYKVWQGKYGPFNFEQAEYAEQVILAAFARIGRLDNPFAQVRGVSLYQREIEAVVNHERVHEGFLQRADPTVTVTDVLQEVLS